MYKNINVIGTLVYRLYSYYQRLVTNGVIMIELAMLPLYKTKTEEPAKLGVMVYWYMKENQSSNTIRVNC